MQNQKGFTLVEMLAVIAIIGILASITTASLSGARERARDATRLSDMGAIRAALELYYEDHEEYPHAGDDGKRLGHNEPGGIDSLLLPYINPIPKDPLDNGNNGVDDFFYAYDSNHAQSVSSTDCSASGDIVVAFGFNRSEGAGFEQTRDTCAGGDEKLNQAHYNVALQPAP